jgi:hypothetical protein
MFPNKVPKNARNLAVYKADKINELGIEIYKMIGKLQSI